MPGRDELSDSNLEELLQKYERAEAAVLRQELVAFLKSPECRTAIEETVQKPLESIVQSALANPKFQEQLRDSVIKSLQPELTRAVQTAAANALKNVSITIPDDVQQRMRRDAEEAVRETIAAPPRHAARPRIDTALRNRIFAGSGFLAILLIAAGVYFFWLPQRQNPYVATPEEYAAPSDPTVTTPAPPPQTSRLFETYRRALEQSGLPAVGNASAAELACVDDAIRNAETTGGLEVGALRSSLNGCAATKARPAAPSRIIAGVQAQLSEESRARTCSALQPVTIDGRHGNETSRALAAYVACTAPAGVPEKLETLGDYAAVGVYFIHKRMREAG